MKFIIPFILSSVIGIFVGCGENKEKSESDTAKGISSEALKRHLFVSSGACYSGDGNRTFTGSTSSNVVYGLDVESGQKILNVVDYNKAPAKIGDTPAGIGVAADKMFILVENSTDTTARRIESVSKLDGEFAIFNANLTALNKRLRALQVTATGELLISKSSSIEKFDATSARVGAPFINGPAGACATSKTLITKMVNLNNGNIVYLHAAASQNRIGIVSAAGYKKAVDCKAAQNAPTANSFPTAVAYDRVNNKLIVAYAGSNTATDVNSIYVYSINEDTNAISNPQKIYDASGYPGNYSYLLYGVSAMTLDTADNSLYIATAMSTSTTVVNYVIEKFKYNALKLGTANEEVLTRVGNTPFYPYGWDTKCISDLIVAQ